MPTPENTKLADSRTFPRRGPKAYRTKRLMVVLVGVVLLALVIVNESMARVGHGALWPLLLAAAAFLYLWWLGTLLFDLVFVWHRYIQGDMAMKFLREQVKMDVNADEHGPDDRPHGSSPAELPPKPPAAGPMTQRPTEQGQSEGITAPA